MEKQGEKSGNQSKDFCRPAHFGGIKGGEGEKIFEDRGIRERGEKGAVTERESVTKSN